MASMLCSKRTFTGSRWQNPLTGWTSSADPLETVSRGALTFDSKEAAIGYAKQMGFRTVVREPNMKRPDRLKRFAGYGDNFRCAAA